ncbi:hypothetical protein [Algihabitans albus]|uniref:hypothetical protein n=1 Tax=Algihabitans albus TaxID=2164067 RepID=UPI0013C3011B|nr:hypothetical protein [Algihabitans albus]
MTVSVQPAETPSAPSAAAKASDPPAILYQPGAITSDARLAAKLAHGRVLQGRAIRQSFAAAFRPLTGLLGNHGRVRERYGRVPRGSCMAP